MLSSLLRNKKGRRRNRRSSHYFSAHHSELDPLRGQSDTWQRRESDDDAVDDDEAASSEDDRGPAQESPLLPIFSQAHLDSLPVYHITHAARVLIIQRCETTLSWEQLRSPQVSQFLVKPVLQQIRTSHFSRATLYCLLANCLQFQKEAQISPGNVGISKTRALLAELLAIRMVKEYTTRELIDALSYDFDPLKGMAPPPTNQGARRGRQPLPGPAQPPNYTRTSTLEVAIRAQAKKFLAHPVVVQQLEAIWAGTIVFHSAADSLHRYPVKPPLNQSRHYGATHTPTRAGPEADINQAAVVTNVPQSGEPIRRSVTVYNPQNASLFKLSRLRVPRYRQIFSTLSFAIMLGLFLSILIERSLDITSLEVIFWFWSVGFMLDEIVGFSEQGFGLYIMSVWNVFDIGILMLFCTYYVLRLYGILIADDKKHRTADIAYDVLASTAVLLFPRLFSLLDHYRYFSQLLIAFRLMAQDLAAVLILILISCSGFFVAFTLSFRDDYDAASVAYALFQILMGFTPAAWEAWDGYNLLGKIIMTLFLIICHFLVVTILITVLTNSFMAIAQNANDEHQFLFAVNTISMVKSDALFSYVAPTNIAGWIFSPIRYVTPFRRYVKINRSIIKVTHVPVLFAIFFYERFILSMYRYDPTGLIEQMRPPTRAPGLTLGGASDMFSPGVRLREPSVAAFHKDRALEEVFRRPFKDSTIPRPDLGTERRASTNVVDSWMKGMVNEGGASPPLEQANSVVEQLHPRRPRARRSMTSQALTAMDNFSFVRTKSDDAEQSARRPSRVVWQKGNPLTLSLDDLRQQTDADGDDELFSNDPDNHLTPDRRSSVALDGSDKENHGGSDLLSPTAKPKIPKLIESTPGKALLQASELHPSQVTDTSELKRVVPTHNRESSTNTILFNPVLAPQEGATTFQRGSGSPRSYAGPSSKAVKSGQNSPKRQKRTTGAKARPIMPPRGAYRASSTFSPFFSPMSQANRVTSMDTIALDLASDIGDNRYRPSANIIGAMPASFQTQLAHAQAGMRQRQRDREKQDDAMMGRIVLTRMNKLEEGFKDILKEVKEWRNAGSQGTSAGEEGRIERPTKRAERKGKRKLESRIVTPLEPEVLHSDQEEQGVTARDAAT